MKDYLKKFFNSFIWLIVVVFVIDIITKWCFLNYFKETIGLKAIADGYGVVKDNTIPVLPGFLHIGCTLNKGAAWSVLASDNYDGVNPILIVISVVLSGALIFFYVKEFKKLKTPTKVALALMISGALGNLVDRAFYRNSITGFKGVIDWIYVAFMKFPTFNIADSALVIGVIILLVLFIIDEVKEIIQKGKNGEYKYSPKELEEKNKNEANQNR